MNVVKEIARINDAELAFGTSGASWHDEYQDSAYIFVGGLHFDLTEGDVITIFSQYGEIMDINMPRDKETGKTKGFGFIMYEDQRSTILAVDNLNGAKVLEKTLRVDHVKNYKQPKIKGEDGEWLEPDEQSLNAKPQVIIDEDPASDSSVSSTYSDIDPEDPMRDYLIEKRREEKAKLSKTKSKSKGKSSKGKHKDETPEERRARKARKKEKKERKLANSGGSGGKSAGMRGVEELLNSLGGRGGLPRSRSRSPRRRNSRSPTPVEDRRARSVLPRKGPYADESEDDRRHHRDRGRRRSSRDYR